LLLLLLGVFAILYFTNIASVSSTLGMILLFGCVFLFWLTVVVLFWGELLQRLVMGRECPVCGKRTMRRLARAASYFECVHCGARRKRVSPRSPWEDASGPEADALYRRGAGTAGWETYATPEPTAATVSGRLLQSKRIRDQSEPAGDSEQNPSD
jgi:hypothetical protein